jgi:putative ABC transport system permease protein
MLFTLSWRNIWRNRRRSLIVITAIAIGITALVLTDAIYNGLLIEILDNQIRSHIAHIEIHSKGFNDNKIIENSMQRYDRIEAVLAHQPNIESFSRRVITSGIISSASNSSGIMIIGVEPDRESKITKIKESVVAGRYLDTAANEIIISKKLAEKLTVELDDKLVLMVSDVDGHVSSDVFRVSGLYRTSGADFDRFYVYIPLRHAQQMTGLGSGISEIAIITRNTDQLAQTQSVVASSIGDTYEVLTYLDLIPNLIMLVDVGKQSMVVYYLIIGIAILFGIINTMLMSVFERTRELGILMATGMKNLRIFSMIIIESFFLSIIGTLIGVAIGLLIYAPLASNGIDLSVVGEGFTLIGASPVIHPILTARGMANALTIIPLISMIAAIYPAYKATRLEPVRAIQYI